MTPTPNDPRPVDSPTVDAGADAATRSKLSAGTDTDQTPAALRDLLTTSHIDAPPRPAVAVDPPPGFAIDRAIGAGGMGAVYLARQHGLNRPVALKTLKPGATADPKGLIRFLAEAEAVAAVRHPNVVEVYSFGEHAGRPYMAMEFCPGGDLSNVRQPEGRDAAWFRTVAELMGRVADGVQAAHALGIVHRDLKPHNVLIAADGTPKVTDFGLAKRGLGSDITDTNAVMGTPAYMSPEQAGGGTKYVGPEADVWALGVMLYERAGGRRPFTAPTPVELVTQVLAAPVPPLRGVCPAVPPDLALIAHKCLSRDPRERYPTAGGLATDLRNWLDGKPISARPAGAVEQVVKWARRNPRAAWGVAVVAAVLVLGTWVSTGQALRATSEKSRADGEAAQAREQKEAAERSATEAAEQKTRADEQAAVARETTAFLAAVFHSFDSTGLTGSGLMPAGAGGAKVTVAELIDRGVKLVRDERFRGADRNTLLVRAALLDVLGDISRSLARYADAQPLLEEAVEIRKKLLPADDPDRLTGEFHMARWAAESGEVIDADRRYNILLDTYRRTGRLDTLAAADVRLNYAVLLTSIGEDQAEEFARAAFVTRLRLLGENHRDTHVTRIAVAGTLFAQNRYPEALDTAKPVVKWLTELGGHKDPIFSAGLDYQVGMGFHSQGLNSLAAGSFRSANDKLIGALGREHPYRTVILAELGLALAANGDRKGAEAAYREAVEIVRGTMGMSQPQVLVLLERYATLLADDRRFDDAWALAEEVLCASEGRFGRDVPWRFRLVCTVGKIAARCGRHAIAGDLADEAFALFDKPAVAARRTNVVQFVRFANWLDELADLKRFRRAYDLLRAHPLYTTDAEARWVITGDFGTGLARKNLYVEADPHLTEAIKLGDNPALKASTHDAQRAYVRLMGGKSAWANGRHADARELLRDAAAREEKRGKSGDPADPLGRLIALAAARDTPADLSDAGRRLAKLSTADPPTRSAAFAAQAAGAPTDADRKAVTAAVEKEFGTTTLSGPAMDRARAVLAAGGDVAREADRLDALINKGNREDGVLIARAACALTLGKPDDAAKALADITAKPGTGPRSHLRLLLAAAADHRRAPTDATRDALKTQLTEADRTLTAAASGTDPDLSRATAGDLIELRRWRTLLADAPPGK